MCLCWMAAGKIELEPHLDPASSKSTKHMTKTIAV